MSELIKDARVVGKIEDEACDLFEDYNCREFEINGFSKCNFGDQKLLDVRGRNNFESWISSFELSRDGNKFKLVYEFENEMPSLTYLLNQTTFEYLLAQLGQSVNEMMLLNTAMMMKNFNINPLNGGRYAY
jgi:hypothetical protein